MDSLRAEYANDPELLAAFKRDVFSRLQVERPDGSFGPYDPEGKTPGSLRHEGQVQVHFPEPGKEWTMFVLRWGNRCGKSQLCIGEAVVEAGIPGSRTWIAAPEYDLTDKVGEPVYQALVQDEIFGDVIDRKKTAWTGNKREIYLKKPYRSFVKGKSTDNERSLQGEKLTKLILDEASRVRRSAWENGLKNRLIDLKGDALIISTPVEYNWFDELWNMGQDPTHQEEDGIYSMQLSSYHNPYLDPKELDKMRRMAESSDQMHEFKRNILAEPGFYAGLMCSSFIDKLHPHGNLYRPQDWPMPPNATHYGSIDTGIDHPTGALRLYVRADGTQFYYWDYEQRLDTHEDHADQIMGGHNHPVERWIIGLDSDSRTNVNRSEEARETTYSMYRRVGFPRLQKFRIQDYVPVASLANSMFAAAREKKSATPGILISEECVALRSALKRYVWNTPKHENVSGRREGPRKYKDDLAEAFMRAVASKPAHRISRGHDTKTLLPYQENGQTARRRGARPTMSGVDNMPSYMKRRTGLRHG